MSERERFRNALAAVIGGIMLAAGASGQFARADEYYPSNEPILIPIFPEPSATDLCGVDGDGWAIPENIDFVYYEQDELIWSEERVDGIGKVTILAYPQEGYTFPEGATTAWTFTFTDEPCTLPEPTPTEAPTETPTPTQTAGALIPPSYIDAPPAKPAAHLASTGGTYDPAVFWLALMALVLGLGASYTAYKRAR